MSKLTFWGVQGSTPGNNNNKYGSNTSCVSIENNQTLIILDAGTGIRKLADTLDANNYQKIILLLTHPHWDHIQGFPYFNFINKNIKLYVYTPIKTHFESLINQLNNLNHPLDLKDLTSEFIHIDNLKELKKITNFTLKQIQTNHHKVCYGYRIIDKNIDITYIPDNQLHYTSDQITTYENFIDFCKNTTFLIHDSQYTKNDMPDKLNWGHSIFTDTVKLGSESNAKNTILFHHDPSRTTTDINTILQYAKSSTTNIIAAKEGLEINLLGK